MMEWNTKNYDTHARFVSDLGSPVLDLLNPQPNERILDLGCGDGKLTLKLKEIGVNVIGSDSSEPMVKATQQLGVEAIVLDGQALDFSSHFQGKFNAVFSNAALHWMKKDPKQVIKNVFSVLENNGRFVAEMGGHLNVATVHSALIGALQKRGLDWQLVDPWFFPSAEEYASLLESEGFKVQSIQIIPRQTTLPTDVGGWLDTFGQVFFEVIKDEEERKKVKKEIFDQLQPVLKRGDTWTLDYVRLRFHAIKL